MKIFFIIVNNYKSGFEESGRRIHAIKYDDGSYQDEILMTKLL